ncbi:MAG TPA: MarR family transcriptional regulator [Firmicutes bacterium]|nr:MarR family transcriptional regulator [Candidatus Fermentithermobacillaceae bacterium]
MPESLLLAEDNRRTTVGQIIRLLHSISGKFGKEITRAMEGRVSASQFIMLMILKQTGPAKASEIAKKMQLTPSAITFMSKDLFGKNLIKRKRDDDDRRAVYIHITEEGFRIVEEIETSIRQSLEGLLVNLTNAELSNIVLILDKLDKNIRMA